MSINVSIGVQIPTNVVEIGNEISADQLSAITNSSNAPSAANPFATNAFVTGQGYLTTVPTKTVVLGSSGGSSYSVQASDFGNIVIFDNGSGSLFLDYTNGYPDDKELLIFVQQVMNVNASNFTSVYGSTMFAPYSWIRVIQHAGNLYLA